MEFVVYKSEQDNTGRLVELVYNRHCEHYEVVVNGLTEFNSQRYEQANYEFEMECIMSDKFNEWLFWGLSLDLVFWYLDYIGD